MPEIVFGILIFIVSVFMLLVDDFVATLKRCKIAPFHPKADEEP